MAEEVIQEEAVEAVEAEEVNTRFNMEGTGYVNPGNVYTHCDRIPYPWQEELEQALNIAGGHVKYGIGNPEDEFCSEEDLKAWIE